MSSSISSIVTGTHPLLLVAGTSGISAGLRAFERLAEIVGETEVCNLIVPVIGEANVDVLILAGTAEILKVEYISEVQANGSFVF